MRSRPLRVAVTREESSEGALSKALWSRGLEPVSCAVLTEADSPEPEALARAASTLESYDWLVVASQRAVTALMEARAGRPIPPGLRTAAVGAKTAAQLEVCGAASPLMPPVAGAAALIQALRAADLWPGRRVLLPHALEGGRELGQALRCWGAQVDEVVAYCTVERPAGEVTTAWYEARPDAVVVASPSAARALVRAVGADALRRLEYVAAIGSTTAMTLVALGVPAIVSARSDFDAVAELLTELSAVASKEVCR